MAEILMGKLTDAVHALAGNVEMFWATVSLVHVVLICYNYCNV
jgi:hypothetical protein